MQISRRALFLGSAAGFATTTIRAQQRRPAPARPADLAYLSVADASELIRTKHLSPVELTRALLDRIDRLEPTLHAFITIDGDGALEAARSAERDIAGGTYRGPMHGIPFGVKDTHYTRGIRTTAGSPVLAGFVPSFDATVVARLKTAGAVLVGKTILPEFSFGAALRTPEAAEVFRALGTGVPVNPWDVKRSPGGSSTGSAIAVAAGMLPAATGGDTSASIRSPAGLCGIVGLKPTYGRVSRYGVATISFSLDHVGPMTRTVEDNALLLAVIAGHNPSDASSSTEPVPDYAGSLARGVRGLRIGVPAGALTGIHPDVRRAIEAALALWTGKGARVEEVTLPASVAAIDEVQRIVRIAEAASYHEPFLATARDRYGSTGVKRDVLAGSFVTAVQYLRAQKIRAKFTSEMQQMFRGIDLIVTPTGGAPAGESSGADQNFLRMFDVCGFPALALPVGFSTSPAGLPMSAQIVAAPFAEETIYAAAYAYEEEMRTYERHPAL